MIVPTMSPIRWDLLPGLDTLFEACGEGYMVGRIWNPGNSLIALHEGCVVGFVSAWHDNQPYAWIDPLLVHPEHRGKGIGVWLGWTMEAILQKRGVNVIRVLVREDGDLIPQLKRSGMVVVGQFTVLEKTYGVA